MTTSPRVGIQRGTSGAAVAIAVLLLGGCATFSEDGGFGAVESATRESLGKDARWVKDEASRTAAEAEITRLLEDELTPDAAMQVALLGNPRLQAEYANLGISEADRVQAGRLPNPGFTFAKSTGGGHQEIERGLHFNLLALLTLPVRAGIESRRFEAAQLAAAAASVEVALEARAAYFDAVAAREAVAYFEQVLDAAEASRELMSGMTRVGNASRLALAREQLFHAEATAALARARQVERAAREALIRHLGRWGEQTALRLPARLPELPAAPEEIADIEQIAIAQRFDLRQARHALDGLSASLGLANATRFVNVLELGLTESRERGEPIRDGYEISLEIPIFDGGGPRLARAEALYRQGAERLRARAIDTRSQVREAYLAYRTAYDLARHYRDEIVPLRKRISDEQLLRYNGMLIGVFELIADARDQVGAVSAYMSALREFWLADTALHSAMLVGGGPPMPSVPGGLPGAASAAAH